MLVVIVPSVACDRGCEGEDDTRTMFFATETSKFIILESELTNHPTNPTILANLPFS